MKYLLPFSLCLFPFALFPSALSQLAASMNAGEWAELKTNNLDSAVCCTGGSSGFIFGYTESVRWDPATRRIFYFGGDHQSGFPARFVSYAESTNTWETLPPGPYSAPYTHGYDHMALDPVRRFFYIHPGTSTRNYYRYQIDTKQWSALPPVPSGVMDWVGCCDGVEYFPELQGLFVNASQGRNAILFREGTNQWKSLSATLAATGYQTFAEYNPVHKVMLAGGGNSVKLYIVDATEKVTNLKDAPTTLIVNSSVHTLDPVSGDYLIFKGSSWWVYDVAGDQWQQKGGTVPPILSDAGFGAGVYGVEATPVAEHGITFFVKAGRYGKNNAIWLYKHSNTSPTRILTLPEASASALRVFPNPIRGRAVIAPEGARSPFNARVFNARGRAVMGMAGNGGSATWDASGLPGGIYLLKVSDGRRKWTKVLFKE